MARRLTPRQNTENSVPELLTDQQISRRFNISINTLRFWRQIGDGPDFIKLGKLVRYDVNALKAYIQRNLRVSKARATPEETDVAQ